MGQYDNLTALITGGTGSFGQVMTRRLLDKGCSSVRVLSRDEAKQHYMRLAFDDPRLSFYLGDVRDRRSVDNAMAGVDLVFHAAALKQVPSCEFFPIQAVWTNVIGSANVIESAQAAKVDKIVCLSTDKAVMPVNAMGMSKALMEKVALAAARHPDSTTTVCSVRYGNVMYSRGSVLPLFVDQIRAGAPLTVTDPEMTRFLLSLDVAVGLVEYAFEKGQPGDIFIRKAPAATMGDTAEAMRRLFGVSNPIEVIGVRHGEKLYETLATQQELRSAEDLDDFWRVRMDSRDLNYASYYTEGDAGVSAIDDDYHSHNTERLNVEQVMALIGELPELRAAIDAYAAA
jgi:UDP-N-acetylglucosamine 4,6-dehydratase/5-epimerase